MTKVIGMLVALAMFCAMPAVALAQDSGESSGDTVSSGNTQEGEIEQDADGGDGGADGGDGGDAGNQAAICQQNAGRDANCSIDQSQSFGGDTFVDNDDNGVDDDDDVNGEGGGDVDNDNDNDNDNVTSGGVGGGVNSVTLARTGFDAWVLALIGGLSLAGGLGLLAAQRRGRLNA
jgi:hypothetical protein